MSTKRRPLGKPLPPVKPDDNTDPTPEQVDRTVALWDSVVPAKWRGMLDPRPMGWTGKPKPNYFYDERGLLFHASGRQVTTAEKRAAILAYEAGTK